MDLPKFIEYDYDVAQGPALYIVSHGYPPPLSNIRRCGAAATRNIGPNSDFPYGSKPSSLVSRCRLYNGFFLPGIGQIHAFLTQPRRRGHSENQIQNADGTLVNRDPGDQRGIVISREKIFHKYLDEAGMRWDPNKKNELFEGDLDEQINILRKVPGLQMYICRDNDVVADDPSEFNVDDDDDPGPTNRKSPRLSLIPSDQATAQRLASSPTLVNAIVDLVDRDEDVDTVSIPSSDADLEEEFILVPARYSEQKLRDALRDETLKKVIAELVKETGVDLVTLKFKNKDKQVITLQPPRGTSSKELQKWLDNEDMKRVLAGHNWIWFE